MTGVQTCALPIYKHTTPKPSPDAKAPAVVGPEDRIFDFWKMTLHHLRSNLDVKRRALIKARLKEGYTEEQLTEAVVGCSRSNFHQGQNDKGKIYDGLELIFRDASHVDQFLKLAAGEGEKKLRSRFENKLDSQMERVERQLAAEQEAKNGHALTSSQNGLSDISDIPF